MLLLSLPLTPAESSQSITHGNLVGSCPGGLLRGLPVGAAASAGGVGDPVWKQRVQHRKLSPPAKPQAFQLFPLSAEIAFISVHLQTRGRKVACAHTGERAAGTDPTKGAIPEVRRRSAAVRQPQVRVPLHPLNECLSHQVISYHISLSISVAESTSGKSSVSFGQKFHLGARKALTLLSESW